MEHRFGGEIRTLSRWGCEIQLPLAAARGAVYALALGSGLWLLLIGGTVLTRALLD